MRVKNESRWIEKSVTSLARVADKVLVLDDHSTDDTAALARRAGAVVVASPFTGVNEHRDKDFLVEVASREFGPFGGNDWAVMLDGDEVLDDHWTLLNRMQAGLGSGKALAFQILYLWDSENQIRTDGIYGSFYRASAWPIGMDPSARFSATEFGGNFHCGSVPGKWTKDFLRVGVRVWHYGYLHKEDRIRKYYWYNQNDPNNEVEDGYRHMVIGDLFPADSKFRWGGPLKIQKTAR